MKKLLIPSILLVLVLSVLSPGVAYDSDKTYIVDVDRITPNVIINEGRVTGFDIDIWEAIADDMGLDFEYKEVPFNQIFTDLKNGKADVGIAAITINENRERFLDFSHHYMDSGLRIAVPSDYITRDISAESIFSPLGKPLLYLTIFVFICCNILWFFERGNSDAVDDHYIPGVFQALWCTIATMTTVGYGDIAPKRWAGRICSVIIMLIGISFFGLIVSQVTSVLTLEKFKSKISNYHDLKNKTVVTKNGTTSEQVLQNIGADVLTYESIDEAYQASIENKLPVVFDSPSILYFANNDGIGKISVVGDMFDLQYYGFVLQNNSELREKINQSLLKLRDSGEYNRIYKNWFDQ